MFRIKRTKAGAVHYAAAVNPRGTVDAWTADPAAACVVTDGLARRLKEYHAGRPNVGQLAFEPAKVDAATAAAAVAHDTAAAVAEFAALQAECKRLTAENAALARRATDAEQSAAAAIARADGLDRELATALEAATTPSAPDPAAA